MSENYVDDMTEVEPIAVYENTEEQKEQFEEDLWQHEQKPQTIPDDVDTDDPDFDWDEVERVPDEERASEKAQRWFNFVFGYAGYGKLTDRNDLVAFKIPGWFAQDELGPWEEWWFGTLEVAKEDDGEFTAICFSDIEPMSDRNEDSYFRNPIEEEWIPVSLMEFAFGITEEVKNTHLLFERGLDSSTIDHSRGEKGDADIVVKYARTTQYGEKFVLDSPFEAKDDIKNLDWDQFHPNWTGDNWEFDAGALWPFVEEMTMQGWTVCVTEVVENRAKSDSMAEGPYLPAEATEE